MKRSLLLLAALVLLGAWSAHYLGRPVPPANDPAPERPSETDAVDSGRARDEAGTATEAPTVVEEAGVAAYGDALGLNVYRTISGTVRDRDERPVAGALVRQRHVSGPVVRTDALGRYQLATTGMEPVLSVEADGYPRATRGASRSLDTLDFVLSRAATIQGRVVDGSGRGVPGAQVSELADRDRFVVSGPDGAFRFPGARTDYPTALQARREGWVPGRTGVLELSPGKERRGVIIVTSRGATIRGHVIPWIGTPPAVAVVSVGGEEELTTKTAADGAFTLRPVPGKKAVLRASTPDGRMAECTVADLPPGGEVRDVKLRLGAVFHGQVLDSEGKAVSGARVRIRCPAGRAPPAVLEGRTDGKGTVRIAAPFTVEWEVDVSWPEGGLAISAQRVTATEEPRVFRLPRSCSVCGRVTRDGRPVRQFRVRFGQEDRSWERSGENGSFRFASLRPGTTRILVTVDDGWSEVQELTLAPGESREGLEFEVVAAPVIVCHVVDEDGDPVEGADVRLSPGMTGLVLQVRTDRAGRAELKPGEPGRHLVMASHRGRVGTGKIDVAAGSGDGTLEITVSVTESGRRPR